MRDIGEGSRHSICAGVLFLATFSIFDGGAALPFPRAAVKSVLLLIVRHWKYRFSSSRENGPSQGLYNERSERDDSLAHNKTTLIRASETHVHIRMYTRCSLFLFISPRLNYWRGKPYYSRHALLV